MREGAQHEQITLFVDQLRWYRGQATAVEQIHKKRFENVIAVAAQNDRGAPLKGG
jgi:hypothetical protein